MSFISYLCSEADTVSMEECCNTRIICLPEQERSFEGQTKSENTDSFRDTSDLHEFRSEHTRLRIEKHQYRLRLPAPKDTHITDFYPFAETGVVREDFR